MVQAYKSLIDLRITAQGYLGLNIVIGVGGLDHLLTPSILSFNVYNFRLIVGAGPT
jgi:hypothetical protein